MMSRERRERIRQLVMRIGAPATARRMRMTLAAVQSATRAATIAEHGCPPMIAPALDARAVVRRLLSPQAGVATSLEHLAALVAEWCATQGRGWQPTAIGTLKRWSASRVPIRPRAARFRRGVPAPGPLGVLAEFARAGGVDLAGCEAQS